MAKAAGVTARSQRNYESGIRSPDATYLVALGSLGVDLQYVLTGKRCYVEIIALEAILSALIEHLKIEDGLLDDVIEQVRDAVLAAQSPRDSAQWIDRHEYSKRITAAVARLQTLAAIETDQITATHAIDAAQEFLTTVIEAVEREIEATGARITASNKAQVVMTVYIGSRSTRIISNDLVRRIIKLVSTAK